MDKVLMFETVGGREREREGKDVLRGLTDRNLRSFPAPPSLLPQG